MKRDQVDNSHRCDFTPGTKITERYPGKLRLSAAVLFVVMLNLKTQNVAAIIDQ